MRTSSRASTWGSRGRSPSWSPRRPPTEDDVKAYYRLDGAEFSTLKPVDRFLAATGLTARELAELLFGQLERHGRRRPRAGDPSGCWRPPSSLTRAVRRSAVSARRGHARLGRGPGVRAVAVVRPRQPVRPARPRRRAALHRPRPRAAQPVRQRPGPRRRSGPLAVVKYLAASLDAAGGRRLQPRRPDGHARASATATRPQTCSTGRSTAGSPRSRRAVVRGSGFVAPAHRRHRVLTCTGDLLAPRNTEFRRRLVRALGLSEADLAEIVRRFRQPLPRPAGDQPVRRDETGLAALSLLHRVSTLTARAQHRPRRAVRRAGRPERRPVRSAAATPSTSSSTRRPGSPTATGSSRAVPSRTGCGWCRPSSPWSGGCRRPTSPARSSPRSSAATPQPAPDRRRRGGRPAGRALPAVPGRPAGTRGLRRPTGSARGPPASSTTSCSPAAGPSPRATRELVRVDRPGRAEPRSSAAYACLLRLPVIEERDFVGLGLAEHVQQKIFANLVLRGYLDGRRPRRRAAPCRRPRRSRRWPATSTPSARRCSALIGGLCRDDGRRSRAPTLAAVRPGGAGRAVPGRARRAVRQPRLQPLPRPGRDGPLDGVLRGAGERRPTSGSTPTSVRPGPRCGSGCGTGWPRLRHRPGRARPRDLRGPAAAPRRTSAACWRTSASTATSTATATTSTSARCWRCGRDGLDLALEFYPHRRAILDAIQAQLDAHRSALLHDRPRRPRRHRRRRARRPDPRRARRHVPGRRGGYRDDQLVYLRDGGGPLGLWLDLDAAAEATICERIAAVIVEQQPYHLDPAALAELDLGRRRGRPAGRRPDAGRRPHRGPDPARRTASPTSSTSATRSSTRSRASSDYAMDVFFLLHAVAQELVRRAPPRSSTRLEEHAATQRRTFFAALQDGLGIPAETVEAICRALCGDVGGGPRRPAGAGPRRGRGAPGRSRPSPPTAGSARCTGGWRGSPCSRRSSA